MDSTNLMISSNLLQMNFMRKTLVAREKNAKEKVSVAPLDPNNWIVKLPEEFKDRIRKINAESYKRPSSHLSLVPSIYEVTDVPAGSRLSFRGFNPAVEQLMASGEYQNQTAGTAGELKAEATNTEEEVARIRERLKKAEKKGSSRPRKLEKLNGAQPPQLEEGELTPSVHKRQKKTSRNSHPKQRTRHSR